MRYANVCYVIIETIVNIEHETACLKGHSCFSKKLFMSISLTKNEIPGFHSFSFFALSNLLTQTGLHFCTYAGPVLDIRRP